MYTNYWRNFMEDTRLSEQEIVRRNKMQELIDKGIDPFGSRYERTRFNSVY